MVLNWNFGRPYPPSPPCSCKGCSSIFCYHCNLRQNNHHNYICVLEHPSGNSHRRSKIHSEVLNHYMSRSNQLRTVEFAYVLLDQEVVNSATVFFIKKKNKHLYGSEYVFFFLVVKTYYFDDLFFGGSNIDNLDG